MFNELLWEFSQELLSRSCPFDTLLGVSSVVLFCCTCRYLLPGFLQKFLHWIFFKITSAVIPGDTVLQAFAGIILLEFWKVLFRWDSFRFLRFPHKILENSFESAPGRNRPTWSFSFGVFPGSPLEIFTGMSRNVYRIFSKVSPRNFSNSQEVSFLPVLQYSV